MLMTNYSCVKEETKLWYMELLQEHLKNKQTNDMKYKQYRSTASLD